MKTELDMTEYKPQHPTVMIKRPADHKQAARVASTPPDASKRSLRSLRSAQSVGFRVA